MNTKNSKCENQKKIESIFLDYDIVEHETSMLAQRFLSQIITVMNKKGIKQGELAKMINTSSSYLTQIFRGNKLPNLNLLVRMSNVLGVKFKIHLDGYENLNLQEINYYKKINVTYPATKENFTMINNPADISFGVEGKTFKKLHDHL